MMKSEDAWSLEGEICDRAKTVDIQDALIGLGLMPAERRLELLDPDGEWRRGGSETYLFTFSVIAKGGWTKKYLLKALVPFSAGVGVAHVAEEWIGRRMLLGSAGVKVPRLYGVHKATLLEEYIPCTVEEALRRSSRRHELIRYLLQYCAALARLGFAPASCCGDDLRTFGCDVIPVDFGSDLGPAGQEDVDPMIPLEQLTTWLRRLGLDLPGDARDTYVGMLSAPTM